jgi:3'(2'), 5'-bisphosphate nucleotidase
MAMVTAPAGVDYARELEVAEQAARDGGAIVLRHYRREDGVRIEIKPDQSPVTEADLDANRAIVDRLRAAFPDDGILSEELPDSDDRLGRRRVWIIDPLDGTRDFVARTDQFCVHVGLAVDGVAVVGAVYQPVAGLLFSARAGGGAFQSDGRGPPTRLRTSAVTAPPEMRVGVSRLNPSGRLGETLAATGLDGHVVAMGASVKYMALARGALDLVVNLSPGEQEWDTCAPEVVMREAGGVLTDGDGQAFRYNQRDPSHRRGSVASNGACHAALTALLHPHFAADTV